MVKKIVWNYTWAVLHLTMNLIMLRNLMGMLGPSTFLSVSQFFGSSFFFKYKFFLALKLDAKLFFSMIFLYDISYGKTAFGKTNIIKFN